MKIPYLTLLALFALCGASSAISAAAEQYCQQQATPCVKQCCPYIDGTWSEEEQDCIYPGAGDETLEEMLQGPCGSCAAQMMTCLSTYGEAPLPPEVPPYQHYSGCCATSALLGLLGAAAFLRRS
jgi:hypothetical protein